MARKAQTPDIRPFTRQFYRGTKGYLILAVVQTLLLTASNLFMSWLLQMVIDLACGMDVHFSLAELALLAACGVGLIALTYLCDFHSKPRFLAKAIGQYKEYAYGELTKKSISAFSRENTALYISALSNDLAAIENGYLSNTFVILDQTVICIGALALMCWYSPLLTAIAVVLAFLPLVASILTGSLVARAEKQLSDANEQYMSTLKDSLVGFSVIKSFRAEMQLCRMYAQRVQAVSGAGQRKRQMVIIVEMLGAISGTLLQFGVFLIGAYLAMTGKGLSAGAVLVFVQLLNYVISPIGTIPQALAERKAGKELIAKLAEALSRSVREEGRADHPTLQSAITLEHVSFAYEPDKPILSDLSCRFEAGRSYAIVGASGSGKSTLLNLLLASSPDYEGAIRYDDTELRDIRSDALYDLVGVIQQNVFIFNASIRDNITMFQDFPAEQVDRVIALSGLEALIAQRGDGYLCGENGSGLSGGEKQRIAIARSLLRHTACLLADEATAALDAATAHQVAQAILNLEGLTRIVVTHALEESTLRQYDRILTMKAGQVVEEGSFQQLMARKGYFYSLFTVSQ